MGSIVVVTLILAKKVVAEKQEGFTISGIVVASIYAFLRFVHFIFIKK